MAVQACERLHPRSAIHTHTFISAKMVSTQTPLCDPVLLHQRIRLPAAFGLSILSVHDPVQTEALRLPPSLNKAVPKRQREYLAGRRCACEALASAGFPGVFYPAMGEDRLPIWPEQWLGSISHSGDHAVAMAASRHHCSALGIDIQQQSSEKTMHAIQHLIATPEELMPLGDMDTTTKLLLIFSAKESLYKALYPQVRQIQEFDAAALIQADTQTVVLELTRDWSTIWKAGARMNIHYTIVMDYILTATFLCAPATDG
jgi:enterobactin synthetase component D